MMKKLNRLISYLQIPTDQRTKSDIRKIAKHTRTIPLFKKLIKQQSQQVHKGCCQVMRLQTYKEGDQIISFGDIGVSFYIILKGQARTLIPAKKLVSFKVKDIPLQLKEQVHQHANKQDLVQIELDQMRSVNQMGVGASFGEFALINGKPRVATVKAASQVILAVLDKANYTKLIGNFTKKKIQETLQFLVQVPLFKSLTKIALLKLIYHFKKKVLTRNQVLFKEGDPVQSIFFLKSGQFKLTKDILLSKQNLLETKIQKKVKTVKKYKSVELCIKGKNEILGIEQIVNNYQNRLQSCVCYSSTAQVLVISKQDFLLKIPHRDTWEYLHNKGNQDSSRMIQRISIHQDIQKAKKSLEIKREKSLPNFQRNYIKRNISFKNFLKKLPLIQQQLVKKTERLPPGKYFPQFKINPFKKQKRSVSQLRQKEKKISPPRVGPPPSFYREMKQKIRAKYGNPILRREKNQFSSYGSLPRQLINL